jgi:hypothetical protein
MSSLRCVCSVNVRVAFALAAVGGLAVGCGGDGSRGPVGGAWNPGGSGGIGGLTVGATCSGANPAAQTCRTLPDQCIPSVCACMSNGAWACSVDCLPNRPLCSGSNAGDGGVRTDAGTDAAKHSDATIHTTGVDASVSEAGAGDSSKDSTVSSSGNPCEGPCCGDPCCGDPCCGQPCVVDPCGGDPCCGDPCCGQSCVVDPCGGDPCCGDPCCGDPCCGDSCCGDPCCGDPCCGDPCCGVCSDDEFDLSRPLHVQFSSVNDRAAYNLACSVGWVKLDSLGNHRYRAAGCGKMSFYQCTCVGGDSISCSATTCRAEGGVTRESRDK